MVSVISAILFIIRFCRRLVSAKSVMLSCPFPLPLYSQFCSPPVLQCHRCLDVLYRAIWLSCGGRWGGMGVVLNLGEGWPPGSLLYPLRYRNKRDPGDNVSSTQPKLHNLPPPHPPTTFSKSVFLLVPDSVKRKLVSNSPGLVSRFRSG